MDAVLTITMKDNNLNVNGPVDNPLLCLGLLEMAKAVVLKYQEAQASKVQLAPAALASAFRKSDG